MAPGLVAAAITFAAHASPPTVNPEQMDLDPEISAKILKEKAKRDPSAMPAGNSGGGSSSNCGQVNIGNSGTPDKKSISGLDSMFGKQTTVVVQGPVINTANCK
jgi:hypothetical protein